MTVIEQTGSNAMHSDASDARLLNAAFAGTPAEQYRRHRQDFVAPSRLIGKFDRALVELITAAGLLGRGGAGFPTGVKMKAVVDQGKKPVVVVNASEGEPASYKDVTLLTAAPNLILDGALLAAQAVGAKEIIIAVKETSLNAAMALEQAIVQRTNAGESTPVRIEYVPTRFVVGEESALINWIDNKSPRPTLRPPATYQRGVGGRPTLVDNAETIGHIALIARRGSIWFREAGTDNEPGTMLTTVSGVDQAGIYEVSIGKPLIDLLRDAVLRYTPKAVLIGGYFGTWVSWSDAQRVRLSNESLESASSSLGCGVVFALSQDACGVRETARVLNWMSTQSAGQCGSCVNGLASIADLTGRVYFGKAPDNAIDWLDRWANQIAGRGACRLPDGAVRFMQSALDVFADDIAAHKAGRPCVGSQSTPVLPLPKGA